MSFKERVKNELIAAASLYKIIYVDYDYLVCSDAFQAKEYYIINAKPDNFLHLTGVNTSLSPNDFFTKCYDGTLQENDFDFKKPNQSEGQVKGTVRRKIQSLPDMMKLFNTKTVLTEENYIKNKVCCSFATTDNACTVGYTNTNKVHPKSLLKGNELDLTKAKPVSLLIRKEAGNEKFNRILIGDEAIIIQEWAKIKEFVDDSLIPKEFKDKEEEQTG